MMPVNWTYGKKYDDDDGDGNDDDDDGNDGDDDGNDEDDDGNDGDDDGNDGDDDETWRRQGWRSYWWQVPRPTPPPIKLLPHWILHIFKSHLLYSTLTLYSRFNLDHFHGTLLAKFYNLPLIQAL